MQYNLLDGVQERQPPQSPPLISVRAMLMVAVSTGIMTQTALRSVPNLVMNGERGMANEFDWLNAERGLILGSFGEPGEQPDSPRASRGLDARR